tara:strand:+ start:257 stop:628 length:372 start_codon:yes stop_codon:yes gene_type:complete
MDTLIKDVKENIIDQLDDSLEGVYSSDLHCETCNRDMFIIGTYNAKQWLGDNSFTAIQKIKKYEQEHFGECNTDLSNPEDVANMLAYILGDELLNESKVLLDLWDKELTSEDLEAIKGELEAL